MTAKYFAILTNYGAAQLANAVALGTQMNISAMAVGDGGGTLPVPDPAQTKLVRETRRAAVNQVSIDEKNPNFIIAEQVIPENEGGWFIREIGLFDDNGGLIAVGNAPETYKPNLQEGSGRTQVIQMVLMVSSTQAITLKIDPSVVLATREYVTKSIDAAIQASEDRAAQTYQPKGDYVTNPYLKIELLKKIDKADIAQQLGNDTGKVVSQNLLTTELGKKASVADANSKLAKDQNGADIPDKPKFIENLGLPEKYQPRGDYQPAGDYALKSEVNKKRNITDIVFSGLVYDNPEHPNDNLWFYNSAGGGSGIARTKNGVPAYNNFREGKTGDVAHTDEVFGFGQVAKNLTASRSVGTVYTNSSLKPMTVCISLNNPNYEKYTGFGFLIRDKSGNDYTVIGFGLTGAWSNGFSAIVPPGYSYYLSGDAKMSNWVEVS